MKKSKTLKLNFEFDIDKSKKQIKNFYLPPINIKYNTQNNEITFLSNGKLFSSIDYDYYRYRGPLYLRDSAYYNGTK